MINNYEMLMIIVAISAYLIGCINSSILFGKILHPEKNIREVGSGNPGFTNAMRMGKRVGILTFVGDFTKGVIAVWLGRTIICMQPAFAEDIIMMQYAAYLAGIMCFLGHVYPCFFKFKGGKGILTTWAAITIIDWRISLITICVFLIVLFFSKMVSLASVCAAAAFPIVTFLITYLIDYKHLNDMQYVIFSTLVTLIMAIIIIYKHKSNIIRILNGSERKITDKNSNK